MDERRAIRVVSAEIEREGRFLITRRPAHAVLPNLWEFPGGRVREGERDQEALLRALSARIGCEVDVGELLLEVRHAYDGYDLILAVYRCDAAGREPVCGTVAALAWVPPDELGDYEFPGADQHTVAALLSSPE